MPDLDDFGALSGMFARPAILSVIANRVAKRLGSVRVRAGKETAMVDPVVSSVLDDERTLLPDCWDDSDLPGASAGSVDAGSMRFGDFSDHYMT